MATITARNGQQYTVPDAVEDDYLSQGFTSPNAAAETSIDYSGMKVGELRYLVAERNAGREEADLITIAKKAPKPDLVEALQADDARTTAAVTEPPAVDEPAEQPPAGGE